MSNDVPHQLDFTSGWITVRTSDRLLSLIVRIPGTVVHPGLAYVPPSRATFMAVEALASPEWVGDEYKAARSAWVRVDPGLVEATRRSLDSIGLPASNLLPHQLESVAMAWPQRGILNASEQGTGKTSSALYTCALWNSRKVLVMCPKSVAGEWSRENTERVSSWFDVVDVANDTIDQRKNLLRGLARYDSPRPIIATMNYEMAYLLERSWAIQTAGFDTLVCDESWKCKNRTSQAARALSRISKSCQHVLALGGTPIGNEVADIWQQVEFIDTIRAGGAGPFKTRYTQYRDVRTRERTIHKPIGCLDPVGLMQLLDPIWFRATKRACLNLPPKRYRQVDLDMSPRQREWYDFIDENGERVLGDELSLADERTVMLRLQQVCGDFLPILGTQVGVIETRNFPDGEKIRWCEQFTEDVLVGDPSVRAIFWCRFNVEVFRLYWALREILGEERVVAAWGDTTNEQIEGIKASFNSRDTEGVQVIVAQIDKLHAGHNLQACDEHVFFSHTWSWIKRSQAEDRSDRIGRDGVASRYTDLVYRNSIDEHAVRVRLRKQDLSERMSPHTF